MDLLKRPLAPIPEAGWSEIDKQARLTLNGNLTARSLVDFDGPRGIECAAVNLGRVSHAPARSDKGVLAGLRQVAPLVEVRVPFELSIEELDSISRGGQDPALDAVNAAACRAAKFEENAIFHGAPDYGIAGLLSGSPHKALPWPKEPSRILATVETAVVAIQKAGIAGPYALVLGSAPWEAVMAGDDRGYPLVKRLKGIADKGIFWSPALSGGAVLSCRGGDATLTVGLDFAIGYLAHDAERVRLHLSESFTFRVHEPRIAVELKLK